MNNEQNTQATGAIVATVEQLGTTLISYGLEKETSTNIIDKFAPLFAKANEWKAKAEALVVTDVTQVREMQEARVARLALKDIRVAADKERKALKEDSLRYGKAVQGVYNVIEFLIAPIEEHLQNQEDFAKVQAAKQIALLQEQRALIVEPLQEFIPYGLNLGAMLEDDFNKLVNGAKLQKEAQEREALEAAQATEQKLKEEAAERERVSLENEELKAKAAAAEKVRLAEKAKADAVLAAERKKADELLEAQRATAAKAAKLAADKLAAETAEKNRLQALENERIAAEKKRVAEAKKLQAAPDKIKLQNMIENLTFGTLETNTPEAAQVLEELQNKFESFKNWAKIQINNL